MRSHDVLSIHTLVHGRVLARGALGVSRFVLVGYHGYAESAEVMLERLQLVDGSWTLIAIQALNRFYRGRSQDVVAGWMTRQDREVAIADNIAYVDTTLDTVLGARTVEHAIVHVGFSQGVAMAFRAAVRGGRTSAGVIAVGGDVPPELLADQSARFPRTLLVRGDSDDWYTQGRMDADLSKLRERGAAAETTVVRGGHEWNVATAEAAREAISRWAIVGG